MELIRQTKRVTGAGLAERCSAEQSDLANLVERTYEFWAYLRDLMWAQHFALLNPAEDDAPSNRRGAGEPGCGGRTTR